MHDLVPGDRGISPANFAARPAAWRFAVPAAAVWAIESDDNLKSGGEKVAVAEDIRDDATNASILQPNLTLPDRFQTLIDGLVREVHAGNNIRERQDTIDGTRTSLAVILANLMRAHESDRNRYVAIPLSANDYRRSLTNPLGMSYRPTARVVEYLSASDDPYIELRPGGQFRSDGRRVGGFLTRIRATARLLRLIAGVDPSFSPNANVRDPFDPAIAINYTVAELPIIRMRDAARISIEFTDTVEVEGMRTRLAAYNAFIDLQWIDLLIPDARLADLSESNVSERDEFGVPRRKPKADLLFQRRLYRVFNNSSFNEGGRFYGGWWQHIPSELRRYVTINWAPTIEHDYSNMQAVMLYARENVQLEGDAYALDGIGEEYRPLIKRTFFKLINATGRIKAPSRGALPSGWTWRQLQEAVIERHSRIARHFRSGVGIELQRLDADIAEDVMMRFMERDILVLPVHDSFLTYPGQSTELRAAMVDAFRSVMGTSIDIDEGQLFLAQDDPAALELDEEGVRSLDDTITMLEERDGYERYRARRTSFLRDKDEAWRWRFYSSSEGLSGQ